MAGVLVAFTGLGKKIPAGMKIGASWSIRQTTSGQIRKHRCMNNFQNRPITVGKNIRHISLLGAHEYGYNPFRRYSKSEKGYSD